MPALDLARPQAASAAPVNLSGLTRPALARVLAESGVVPADKALLALEAAIKAGKVPGVSDFGAFTFSDGLHLTPAGAYLVSLTHYACVFAESPEGKVTWATSRLTPEQAAVLQRLAWEVVTSDPDSGVKP